MVNSDHCARKNNDLNWIGPLLACVLVGIVLISAGSQSIIAYVSTSQSTNTLLTIHPFQQPVPTSVAVRSQNEVLQNPPSAGGIVYIVAPAGSGASQVNFSPSNVLLVIGVNNTIVLKNEDTADHTITSNPGDAVRFDTGDISGLSSSAPITFTTPGSYGYHCQFHPASMHGTITVIANPAST